MPALGVLQQRLGAGPVLEQLHGALLLDLGAVRVAVAALAHRHLRRGHASTTSPRPLPSRIESGGRLGMGLLHAPACLGPAPSVPTPWRRLSLTRAKKSAMVSRMASSVSEVSCAGLVSRRCGAQPGPSTPAPPLPPPLMKPSSSSARSLGCAHARKRAHTHSGGGPRERQGGASLRGAATEAQVAHHAGARHLHGHGVGEAARAEQHQLGLKPLHLRVRTRVQRSKERHRWAWGPGCAPRPAAPPLLVSGGQWPEGAPEGLTSSRSSRRWKQHRHCCLRSRYSMLRGARAQASARAPVSQLCGDARLVAACPAFGHGRSLEDHGVVDGHGQLDVAKVSRAVLGAEAARGAPVGVSGATHSARVAHADLVADCLRGLQRGRAAGWPTRCFRGPPPSAACCSPAVEVGGPHSRVVQAARDGVALPVHEHRLHQALDADPLDLQEHAITPPSCAAPGEGRLLRSLDAGTCAPHRPCRSRSARPPPGAW